MFFILLKTMINFNFYNLKIQNKCKKFIFISFYIKLIRFNII